MPRECEWDPEKNEENIRKHGVDFEDAHRIFEWFVATAIDDRDDYGELREISIGMAGHAVLYVVHTDRDGKTRLISARPALPRERKRYEQALREALDP